MQWINWDLVKRIPKLEFPYRAGGSILGPLSLSPTLKHPSFQTFSISHTHSMKLKLKTYQRRGKKGKKGEEGVREMVTTRSSKRKAEEETPQNVQAMGRSYSHQLQVRHHSNKVRLRPHPKKGKKVDILEVTLSFSRVEK